jgi:hypothetical protein
MRVLEENDRTVSENYQEDAMKLTSSIGMLLLGVWLILMGAIPLLNLAFNGSGTVLNVLAIVAGALILVGK